MHLAPPISSRPITYRSTNYTPSHYTSKQTYLVFGHSIPIQEQKFQTDVIKAFTSCGNIKHEALVKNWTQCPLFNVGLLLSDPLAVIQKVDFHVGIRQPGHVHLGEVSGLEYHHRESVSRRLPTQRHQEFTATLGTNLKPNPTVTKIAFLNNNTDVKTPALDLPA